MLEAARQLFLEQGYSATSMNAVAANAGVSVALVYGRFGSKVGLLKKLLDLTIAGDDEDAPLLSRAGPQAMRAETDQRRQLAMFAAGVTAQLERIRPMDDILRSAAAVDPEAAKLRADIQLRQRAEAMRTIAGWIAARGPLRSDLGLDDAAAILWTLTSPETHLMFRDVWHWSAERYEHWLQVALISSLLPDP